MLLTKTRVSSSLSNLVEILLSNSAAGALTAAFLFTARERNSAQGAELPTSAFKSHGGSNGGILRRSVAAERVLVHCIGAIDHVGGRADGNKGRV